MATHIDVYPMRSDTDQNSLVESVAVDPDSEHEPGNIVLNEDVVTDSLTICSPKVHVTDDSDAAAQGQSPRHPNLTKSDHEFSDVQTETVDQPLCCTHRLSNLDQGIPPSIPEEVSDLERAVYPAGGSTPPINTDDDVTPTVMNLQEPLVLCPKIVFLATPLRDGKEANAGDPVLDATETDDSALLTDGENPQEDTDCLIEETSSLPPSSSPPQLFSSSPCASSQSSVGGVKSQKTVRVLAVEAVETLYRASFHPDHHIVPVIQDDCRSESEGVHNHNLASENDIYCSSMVPPSDVEDFSELSRKRAADPHGSSQPTKRPNPGSHLYLPPTPKRATVASQRHQFKKLAAPFRPPLKLSIDGDRPVQNTVGRKVESTTPATLEMRHDRINQRGSAVYSPHRTSKTSRSVTQFKSPLAHGATPAESRTVRLTPAIQALERKLQLLKRAIKVKDNNEEEALVRLAGKWIEAGREVSYGVWDSVKDTGDFSGKLTFMHKSHGWESTDNENTPWGWDTKRGDAEESADIDPSETTGATKQLVREEDDDIDRNTLGTMLRQLGIAPEIFGWDDEKEAFVD